MSPRNRPEAAPEVRYPTFESPFLHAQETVRHVFLVQTLAACAPLLMGWVLFGWRAMIVSGLAIVSCVGIEQVYFRVTRVPALGGRTHGLLTGVLLALTLPPFAPWYVPVVAAAFAVLVGKAIFGGVGHFLWQPALVGRFAVAVLFAVPLAPGTWPILAQSHVLVGDVNNAVEVTNLRTWFDRPAPPGVDAFRYEPASHVLDGLTDREDPRFSSLSTVPPPPQDGQRLPPPVMSHLRPIRDLLFGTRAGGIGETSAILIVVAGLYLVYRNYVKWILPVSILAAAAVTAAIAPVYLLGPNDAVRTAWFPVTLEGGDAGFIYVCYQLLGGELMLAAFFLAPEMTSRPVTGGGQVLFGAGVGALAMLLQLYMDTPIPAYLAVLIMNTFTPAIDAAWRPRVLGLPRFRRRRKAAAS